MPHILHSQPPEYDSPFFVSASLLDSSTDCPSDIANIDIDGSSVDHTFAHLDEEFPEQKVQLERRGLTSQYEQAQIWSSQTVFKFSIAAKLRSIGERSLADDLENCHSIVTYAKCNGCHSVSKFLNRCDRFYCPECQPKLSRERKESVEWWTREIGQPKHVVLTVRNVGRLTKKFVKSVKKMFGRLRRSQFARNWNGGFYSLEVTNEGKGWHLHIHALIDAKYIDARELSIAWAKATRKLGYIVKVKDCRQKTYLQEVTKYAVKGSQLSSWSPAEIKMFIDAFSGVRQFGVFGSLYSKRTEFAEWLKVIRGDKPKCKCGCNEASFYNQNEWEALELKISPQLEPPPKHRVDRSLEFNFVANLDLMSSMRM
jgi:hypothetical protein